MIGSLCHKVMASVDSTSSPRDHAADANPDLARKKQRLSEDPDASPSDSVIIEACEPEDVGTNMDNAIAIEDDFSFNMDPYSEHFLVLSTPGSPLEQIASLQTHLESNYYLNADTFVSFSQRLKYHIERSERESHEWRQRYLNNEADFFTTLATLSVQILRAKDLFNPKENIDAAQVRQAFYSMLGNLEILCSRIIPFLPDALKATLSRRDSAQVSVRQQSLGSLYYVMLAEMILSADAPTIVYMRDHDRRFKLDEVIAFSRSRFTESGVLPSLTATIKTLSGAMRELKDSWPILQHGLSLFNITVRHRASTDQFPKEDVETVLDVTNAYILPAVCAKHPRALPEGFHDNLISLGTDMLQMHIQLHDSISASQIYEHYVKSATDALIPEASDSSSLIASLGRISGESHKSLAQILATSWSMQTAQAFIRSDIMDVRNVGLLSLSGQLVRLYNQCRPLPESFEHPIIQYAVRFMRENEITGYIFGPESRAGLVSQSADIVAFLAATSTYTDAESDIIWRACSTSVEADFVKASFHVLRRLTDFLDFEHLVYLANKYSTTALVRLGVDAVQFLPTLLKELERRSAAGNEPAQRLALVFTSVEILKQVNGGSLSSARERLRHASMTELVQCNSPTFSSEDRTAILKHCVPDILNHSLDATTAVEVLCIFLNVRISSTEAERVLSMLPIEAAVDELYDFIQKTKERQSSMTDILAVTERLELIVRLMAFTTAPPDTNTQRRLFDYCFGRSALSNEARNYAWEKLENMANAKDLPSAAVTLWQSYMHNDVPSLSADLATPRLIEFLARSLESKCTSEQLNSDATGMLRLPLWETVVHFAIVSPENLVVNMAFTLILDLLFVQPVIRILPPETVGQCHSEFVRSHIETLCRLHDDFVQSKRPVAYHSFCRGMDLLTAILQKSRETASSYVAAKEADVLVLGTAEDDAATRISFTAQVYGPDTHPNSIMVHASDSITVSELLTKLPNSTSASENRIIVGGVDVTNAPDKTLLDAGIQQSGVIMIRPKYTFDLDLDKLLTCSGPAEQAIFEQHESLEAFLDGPHETAYRAFCFLQTVRLPSQSRSKVISSSATAQEIFPSDRQYRTKFSLYVLRQHLHDFAHLGVVDRGFILNGVRLLAEFVSDDARTFDPGLMLDVLSTLSVFLREQPHTPEPLHYFENCDNVAARLIDLLEKAKTMPRAGAFMQNGTPLRTEFAAIVYSTLLLACQASDDLWKAFSSSESSTIALHMRLLLDSDLQFSWRVAHYIKTICRDTRMSQEVPRFYWRVIFPGLSEAIAKGPLSESYFSLAVDILHCEQEMQTDEAWVRSLVERLTTELHFYKHDEAPPLLLADKAMVGLLRLLRAATNVLKSHKKPLGLHGLPTQLLGRLLFPPSEGSELRPLVQNETRGLVYDLIRSTFVPEADYEDLIDIARMATQSTVRDPTARFPGYAEWIRPANSSAGLTNLGMTCYMNSLLQQLFANLQFRKFIFDRQILDAQQQDILVNVQTLFSKMQSEVDPVAQTNVLSSALNVQVGVQEDVHSFYAILLSRLEDGMPDSDSKVALTKYFTGKSITQIKGDCGHVSSRVEPFTELSITVKNKASLGDSLDEFVQGEPLEGANKYMCMSCASDNGGRLVNAMKRTCLDEVPDSLTFCLKRFAFDNILEGENKVNDRFEFPPEIDMSRYKRSHLEDPEAPQTSDMFELVGVIVHQGSLSYGHYWSYVREPGCLDPNASSWLYLEDTKFVRCAGGLREVQEACFGGLKWSDGTERPESAYVLFYQRKDYIANADRLNITPKQLQLEHRILPTVNIPQPLATDIEQHNLWKVSIGSLFSDQFSGFLVWLLGQFPQVLDAVRADDSASDASEQSPTSIETTSSQLEAKIGDLIANYALRILVADPASESKLAPLSSSLTTVLTARPGIAAHILKSFSNDPFGFTTLVRNRKTKVRSALFQLIEACVTCTHEQKPEDYNEIIGMLIGAHSSLLVGTLDLEPTHWTEYFTFAANFARLGSSETRIILDSEYLAWIFDVFYMRHEPDSRKRHPNIWNFTKNNSLDHSVLFEFLYKVFSGYMDFSGDPAHFASAPGQRTEIMGRWRLRQQELEMLTSCNQKGLWLLFLAGSYTCSVHQTEWKNFPPGKLLGLLVNENTHPNLLRFVKEELVRHYDLEEIELTPMLHMSLHYCLERNDQEARPLLRSLTKNLVLWDTQERRSLWFLKEAYKLVPVAVIDSVQTWSAAFLHANRAQTRLSTTAWLEEHLFGPAPLSGDSSLEAARIRSTRALVQQCRPLLRNAYNREDSREGWESMISALERARDFLTALHSEVQERRQQQREDHEADEAISGVSGTLNLGTELMVEFDESKSVLATLEHTLSELGFWESETGLPTRTLGVRRSVEQDSEAEAEAEAALEEDELETSEAEDEDGEFEG